MLDLLALLGQPSLHQLILRKDWAAIEARCKTHPREAGKLSYCQFLDEENKRSKALPLHYACAAHAPVRIVMILLSAYRQGTEIKETAYDRLALHTALHNQADLDIIMALVNHYPQALGKQDNLGRTPLFYAIANGQSLELISKFIKLAPQATQVSDYRGWTPLHVACGVGAPLVMIRWLVKVNPQAVHNCSNDGKTPLCFAKKFYKDDPAHEVIDFLERTKRETERAHRLIKCPSESKKGRVGEIVKM